MTQTSFVFSLLSGGLTGRLLSRVVVQMEVSPGNRQRLVFVSTPEKSNPTDRGPPRLATFAAQNSPTRTAPRPA